MPCRLSLFHPLRLFPAQSPGDPPKVRFRAAPSHSRPACAMWGPSTCFDLIQMLQARSCAAAANVQLRAMGGRSRPVEIARAPTAACDPKRAFLA